MLFNVCSLYIIPRTLYPAPLIKTQARIIIFVQSQRSDIEPNPENSFCTPIPNNI